MMFWSPQRYELEGARRGVDDTTLQAALEAAGRVVAVHSQLIPILTLRHLSILTSANYKWLRSVVVRGTDPYKEFTLKKRAAGRTRHRSIHVPDDDLLSVQSWLAQNVLRYGVPHRASHAYHPGCHVVLAARKHVNAKWLLKVDVSGFFDSITERMVYKAFRELGYGRLISLELSRITTRVGAEQTDDAMLGERWPNIPRYTASQQGFLPQGAPSSPMLSNLVMRDFDQRASLAAAMFGFRYTRYADDLAFSSTDRGAGEASHSLHTEIVALLHKQGFTPNARKTMLRGPGARRQVLGLHVDGPQPRLDRDFKQRLELELYYLTHKKHGPAAHAKARRKSITSVYLRLKGLIAWADQVEPAFGAACYRRFNTVPWPPLGIP